MKVTQKELDRIIRNHQHWIKQDRPDWPKMLANLSKADLHDVCLSGVNLSGAILTMADLSGADLSGTDLSKAHMSGAILTEADLTRANMAWAIMTEADLTKANLARSRLYRANLSYANLSHARFAKATLDRADLSGATMDWTDLENADIYTAILDPKEEFRKGIVLKRAIKGYKNTYEGVVITAEIPAGAVVFSINGKKCRTSTATIVNMAGRTLLHSQYDHKFTYRLGQKIIIPNFDTRYNVECSTGFHFFRKKQDAIGY